MRTKFAFYLGTIGAVRPFAPRAAAALTPRSCCGGLLRKALARRPPLRTRSLTALLSQSYASYELISDEWMFYLENPCFSLVFIFKALLNFTFKSFKKFKALSSELLKVSSKNFCRVLGLLFWNSFIKLCKSFTLSNCVCAFFSFGLSKLFFLAIRGIKALFCKNSYSCVEIWIKYAKI